MSRPDAEQIRELLTAARHRPQLVLSLVVPICAVAMVSGVLWAHFAAHDVVTRTEGKIVPSPAIQQVQAREGGILRELLVAEGERVSQGQVIARLEDANFKAEMDSQRARRLVLAAAAARLSAEAEGGSPQIPADVAALAPDAAARQQALFRARRAELGSTIQILSQQLAQRRSEQALLEGRERTLGRSLHFLEQELAMGRDLAAHGLKSRLELLKTERQVSDAEGETEAVRDRLVAARAAVDEAQQRVDERRQAFQSQALQDLAKAHADMAAIDASLLGLTDRLARQDIRAPRDGVVKKLLAAEIGSTLSAGAVVAEEVSSGDDLLIEGKVRSADLALLRPGQTASVRIGAGGSDPYGMLPATLEQVSQVGRTEHDADPSYVVRLHTAPSVFAMQQSMEIHPGMSATVDILIGKQSVLDYLLEPMRKVRQQIALADR